MFAGIHKNSLIDYPGKLSCVLFVGGCNFRCPYCHNPDLVRGSGSSRHWLDEAKAYNFLERRRGFIDGVVLSGGEPTLNPDLASLCAAIKKIGYPLKLDTNGSRPEVIRELIAQGLVDYIAMDIKTAPEHYGLLSAEAGTPRDIVKSIGIIMRSSLPYEFRTTCAAPFVDRRIIAVIARTIEGAMLYALQRFHHHTDILQPEYFTVAEAPYDEEDLIELKKIAQPWVRECIVR